MRTASGRLWLWGCLVILIGLAFLQGPVANAGSCDPVKIKGWYGTYDLKGKKSQIPAPSLKEVDEEWKPPTKANRPYRIGVSFPHLKDPAWVAVNSGVIEEAKCLGVGIQLVAAGGYTELARQINQVEDLANQNIDGLILGAISYSGQDKLVARLTKRGIPVVALLNDIRSPAVRAKSLMSYYSVAYEAARVMIEDMKGKDSVNVVLLPGPAGAAWTVPQVVGFKAAIAKLAPGRVKLLDVKWGDTGKAIQLRLVENVLNTYPDLDYLVGNGLAADAAPGAIAAVGRTGKVKIVSTYITPAVYGKIAEGKVLAAVLDYLLVQGRISVGMMVRLLNGEKPGVDFPFRAQPSIVVVNKENYKSFSFTDLFGPKGYKPVFSVAPRK